MSEAERFELSHWADIDGPRKSLGIFSSQEEAQREGEVWWAENLGDAGGDTDFLTVLPIGSPAVRRALTYHGASWEL